MGKVSNFFSGLRITSNSTVKQTSPSDNQSQRVQNAGLGAHGQASRPAPTTITVPLDKIQPMSHQQSTEFNDKLQTYAGNVAKIARHEKNIADFDAALTAIEEYKKMKDEVVTVTIPRLRNHLPKIREKMETKYSGDVLTQKLNNLDRADAAYDILILDILSDKEGDISQRLDEIFNIAQGNA